MRAASHTSKLFFSRILRRHQGGEEGGCPGMLVQTPSGLAISHLGLSRPELDHTALTKGPAEGEGRLRAVVVHPWASSLRACYIVYPCPCLSGGDS